MEVAEFSVKYFGSAVKFSPMDERVLLVATTHNLMGVSDLTLKRNLGKGYLYILSYNPTNNPAITKIQLFNSTFALLDCSWSHNAPLAAAAGIHGRVSIYNATASAYGLIRTFHAHLHDVRSIDWNPSDSLLTASIDGSVKVWDLNTNVDESLYTYGVPHELTDLGGRAFHAVHWNPVNHHLFATGSSYGPDMAHVFDLREPGNTLDSAILKFPHPEFVVSCGWSGEHILGTTSLDKRVRLWDTRMINNNMMIANYDLVGPSERSRVRFAPGQESAFLTCSGGPFGGTGVSMWDHLREPACVGTFNKHDDLSCAVGVDVSPSGLMATAGLNNKVFVLGLRRFLILYVEFHFFIYSVQNCGRLFYLLF